MAQEDEESWKSSPFTGKAFDISLVVDNREDLPNREKWRSTSHVTEFAYKVFFSLFSLIASECLKDNYTNNLVDRFGNFVDLLFRRFNLADLDDKGSLEYSIKRYIQKLEKYNFFLPKDFAELINDKSSLKPRSLEFDIGYKSDLDSVVECFREVLKSLRDEKMRFWIKIFEMYKDNKEAYDLEFRTKASRHKKDLDRFSKIDIKEYIDKLGSLGKEKK